MITRLVDEEDGAWLAHLWRERWGGNTMMARGLMHHLRDLEGLIAWVDGRRVGAATFTLEARASELVSLDSVIEGRGVGASLLGSWSQVARTEGVRRLWLITSNDNLAALRFYQRRGFRIVAVHVGAIDEARKVKPSIPERGDDGIPIHDEIELETWLEA